jgi:hypothetical protein
VRRIVAGRDPVIRNLQITQCYFELSRSLAALTGPGANWCSIATWASKQAGQSIRKEDLVRTFERLLHQSRPAALAAQTMSLEATAIEGQPSRSLAGAVDVLRAAISPTAAFTRNSEAVARGNRKVFEEIGFEFARFLAVFPDGRRKVAEFCRPVAWGPAGGPGLSPGVTLPGAPAGPRKRNCCCWRTWRLVFMQTRLPPEIVKR